MTTKMYCIEHGIVDAEYELFGHVVKPLVYPPDWEVDFCEFEKGWATCLPPEFDMETRMRRVTELPETYAADQFYAIYDYDVESDQLVTEELL